MPVATAAKRSWIAILAKPFDPDFLARVGGEARLRLILEEFYSELAKDVLVGFFFDGKDVTQIAHKQEEFLLRAMGARPSYTGLPPARAHDKLAPILAGHFDRRIEILKQVLARFGLSPADQAAWIKFEMSFRKPIVSQ